MAKLIAYEEQSAGYLIFVLLVSVLGLILLAVNDACRHFGVSNRTLVKRLAKDGLIVSPDML
jgi:hypothetical protein